MVPVQVERLKRDSRELEHYIHKVAKGGKSDLAYKLRKKQQYIQQSLAEITLGE